MYEDEPREKIPLVAIVSAIIFGAGSVWAGAQGVLIAFSHSPSHTSVQQIQTAAVFDATMNTSIDNVNGTLNKAGTIIKKMISSIPIPSPSTTILIGGDIMFDRAIRSIAKKKGYDYLFASLSPLFKTADIVVANLEGPITTNASKTLLTNGATTDNLAFTFAPASAKALSSAGVTAVSLANNHAYNFGAEGVAETKKWLKQSGVQWFGNPWNTSSTELVVNKNGMNIAFVGYHAFEPGVEKVIADVKRLSQQGDFVIIMPHWGTEYSATPTDKIREQAKAFIAAGAKAIIGSHPHVIMENETIAGVPVYYSVGNLLFDQYFSPEVMKGEIVSLKLVNGPSGPSIGDVQTYGVKLDRAEGVVLE